MKRRILIFHFLLFFFSFSFQAQARRVKSAEELPLTLSNLPKYEIGSDGIAKIDGKKLLFPSLFGGYYNLYQIGEKKFILVAPNEVAEFIINLEGEEGDIVDVIGSGLLEALPEGADSLQWAENFLEHYTPIEIKMKLKEVFQDSPAVLEEIESISEEDLYRITRVVNKFGLSRVIKYFTTIRSYPEEATNPTFFSDALFYLLEGVPNPETALEDFESLQPGQQAYRTGQNPLPQRYKSRLNDVMNKLRRFAEALSIDSRGSKLTSFSRTDPKLNLLQKALAVDIMNGFRKTIKFLRSSAFTSQLKTYAFPLGLLDEVEEIMDFLIEYSDGKLQHLYRVHPFPSADTASEVVLSDLSGNFSEANPPAGIIFWQHPRHRNEVVGRVNTDAYGNKHVELFLLEGGNLKPLNRVTSFQGNETWDRAFYLFENGRPHLMGKLWVRSRFRGGSSFSWQDSDFGFSFVYVPQLGRGHPTPLQLRIEYGRKKKRLDLDLGGPRLSAFLNTIMGNLQQQFPHYASEWNTHHMNLQKLKEQLQQIGDPRQERILLEQLLYFLLPLESGVFNLSEALVVASLRLA